MSSGSNDIRNPERAGRRIIACFKLGYMLETPKDPCTTIQNTCITSKNQGYVQWTISRKDLI